MATTSQLRSSYPEMIRRWSTSTINPLCDFSSAVPVLFPAGTNYVTGRVALRVHPATRQIWRAVAAIMLHHNYRFEESAGGTLACRKITGGSGTTLHAHGIAGDWNPSKNRYRIAAGLIQFGRQTDMGPAMIQDIERIALTNGRHPIRWGGRWTNIKDPMHFEVTELQAALRPVNLASLPAGAWDRYLAFESNQEDPMLNKTSPTSKAVADYQRALIRLGYNLGTFAPFGVGYPAGADGDFGSTAEAATKAFQKFEGLPVTGTGDALTVALALGNANGLAAPGGKHPDGDHVSFATKQHLAQHAAASASPANHPHRHDEGVTGQPTT